MFSYSGKSLARGRRVSRSLAMMTAVGLLCAGCAAGHGTTAAPGDSTALTNPAPPATVPTTPATKLRTPTTPAPTKAVADAQALLALTTEPDQGISPIYSALASPKDSLDMTMYELVDSTAEGILASDAARGVTVRVVLDRNREESANTPAYDYLASHGVQVRWAASSLEATHEKAAVIDAGRPGARALIMTLNLTSRYYSDTRDFAVTDTEPADIAAVEKVFAGDFAGVAVAAPAAVDLVWSPGSQPALVSLIDSARATLAVENEEMGSTAVIDALIATARRGVNTEVTMTANSEWDPAIAKLRAAGVHIHLYADRSSVLYIHAKAIIADAHTAFVGSENFSNASLDNNRELGVVTEMPAVVSSLSKVLAADYAGASVIASPPTSVPATAASPSLQSCHPLTDGGHCYKVGEYCRSDDHGTTGASRSGGIITCEDVRGTWEWETP